MTTFAAPAPPKTGESGHGSRTSRLPDFVLALALVTVALLRLWPGITDTPFHRDEARWVANAALLREWRHPLGPRWQDEGYPNHYGSLDELNRRRAQPPLAMYVLGLGLLVQGQGLPKTGYWIMSQDQQWNIDHGNKPSPGLLHAARRVNVVIAALSVLALYAIGALAVNRIGGVTAGLLYALHPIVLDTSTRAWADPLFVLLVALAALAGYALAKQPTWSRAVLLGLLLGLGGATKLSPLVLAAAIGGLGLVILAWTLVSRSARTPVLRGFAWKLIAVPVFAYAAFVAVYPYLWTAPISHTYRLFDFRADSFRLQGDAFPPADVPNRIDAVRRTRDSIGENDGVGALLANWLHRTLSLPNWTWLHNLDLTLALLGLAVLIDLLLRRGPLAPPVFMVGITSAQAVLVIMSMGVAYPRYFLPIELAAATLAALAVGTLWALIARRHHPRHHPEM
jgi:4-amino-4-deoxy-L-arabinose transferase-like glycosyltransferase